MTNSTLHTSSISAIELHVRSYRSALKSTLEIAINSLVNSHIKMHSILHPEASNLEKIDTSAFVYSLNRLPIEIDKTEKIIIGQNPEVFAQTHFTDIESWPKVSALSRRRATRFNPSQKILAYFAASISDIDDLANTLIAFQIEWNKLHTLLTKNYPNFLVLKKDIKNQTFPQQINLDIGEWQNLKASLGKNWKTRLKKIYEKPKNLRLQLLAGSWINYTKTTQRWWKNIATKISPAFHISRQEIYFISSNTHSILNLFTGFALKHQREILSLIKTEKPELYSKWNDIQNKQLFLDPKDFTYFVFRYYSNTETFQNLYKDYQKKIGIITVQNSNYLNIDAQIFPLRNILKSNYDPRLKISRPQKITNSNAVILNIDYPLGFAAYHVLTEIMENVKQIKGVYIMGKAAVLNSEVGDIQIPRLVFDEHTQNSYIFKNCFNTFFPFTNNQGSILTNQKAVSVLGTFLENKALLDTYSKNNLTVIEMESGPYLSAITEATYDQQAPKNTIIDLNNAPFDIGVINYTSDTPYSGLQNLGLSTLGLNGIEPVNLSSLAVLQRIINLEEGI